MSLGLDKILVNVEVHLKDNLKTDKIEKVIDLIKVNVKKNVPKVSHIQVELETPEDELKNRKTLKKRKTTN